MQKATWQWLFGLTGIRMDTSMLLKKPHKVNICDPENRDQIDEYFCDRLFEAATQEQRESLLAILESNPARKDRVWSLVEARLDRLRRERFESQQIDIVLAFLDRAEVPQ